MIATLTPSTVSRAFLARDSFGFFFVLDVDDARLAAMTKCDVGLLIGSSFRCASGRFVVYADGSAARA